MSGGFRSMLLERFEPMFQLFDMAFLAFPECPLTVISISIRSPPGGGGVSVGALTLRGSVLFFSVWVSGFRHL